MTTYNMKKGDRLPVAQAVLYNPDGSVMDLTGSTVSFRMRLRAYGSTLKVSASATIVGLPTAGTVQFAWGATDTDMSDVSGAPWAYYDAEFVVSSGGLAETVPSSGCALVVIEDTLHN